MEDLLGASRTCMTFSGLRKMSLVGAGLLFSSRAFSRSLAAASISASVIGSA